MRSKIARYGSQPSITSGLRPIAHVPWPSSASPSVSSRSGSNVALASRAPIAGIRPIGLANISPSPRQASSHATAHTSALLAVLGTAGTRGLRAPRGYGRLIPRLIKVKVGRPEVGPRPRIGCRARVRALELLVPAVIGIARGEVGAVPGLDHASDHPPLDPQRLDWSRHRQVRGGQHLLAGHVGPARRHAEQIVEIGVRTKELGVAVWVR